MKVFDRAVIADVLKQGVKGLKLELNEGQVEKLLDYLALLNKWNSVYNLTSVRDPMQMVTLHVLDSLAAVPASEPSTGSVSLNSEPDLTAKRTRWSDLRV